MPIEIRLPAAVLTGDVVTSIISRSGEESPLRRGNFLTRNFENILVLTQATENSCMRIIAGSAPELSIFDQERIMLIAPYSNIEFVIAEGNSSMPPASIFGDEPAHGWCYYYQKADLARQQKNWVEIARLGDEAQKLGLHPNDQVEWMPFLQAYAVLENRKQVKGISTRVNTELFYQQQACKYLTPTIERDFILASEMQDYVDKLFCN